MFGLFKKKSLLVREDDRIYMYRRITDSALVRDIAEASRGNTNLIVSSFFTESLGRIGKQLQAQSVPHTQLNIHHLPHLPMQGTPAVLLLDARHIQSNLGLQSWLTKPEAAFRFFFTEHYPALHTEEQALQALEQASAQTAHSVRFYAGLDDHLFKRFNSEGIIGLMQKMGLEENESISHAMINKSIANAQKKIQQKLTNEFPAASESEWFAKNLPQHS